MNKLYTFILIVILAMGFTGCEDDDCDQLHVDTNMLGIPTVMKGSFPVGTLTPALGDSIIFAPRLLDTTGVAYTWTLNGKEVSSDSVFVYKIEKPCCSEIICTLENSKGRVTMKADITSKHDLAKGMIIVQKGTLDFYDMQSDKLYRDVYSSLNYGKELKIDSYDDFCVIPEDNKLYIAISTSTSNTEHLFVADRATLKAERSAILQANLDAFIPLGGGQALAVASGAYRVKLSSFSKTRLLNKHGWAIYNGAIFNDRLLANMTYDDLSRVNYYDIAALSTAKEDEMPEPTELDIWQNSKVNFVKGRDGNIYTMGCTEDGTAHYIARIGTDFSVVNSATLPFAPLLSGYSSGLYTTGLSLSPSGDAIYIPAADYSIYKYVPGDASSLNQPFIAAPAGEETLCGVGVNVNPLNGELWVCYSEKVGWNEYTGKIVIYDASGKKIKSIDCGDTAPKSVLFSN